MIWNSIVMNISIVLNVLVPSDPTYSVTGLPQIFLFVHNMPFSKVCFLFDNIYEFHNFWKTSNRRRPQISFRKIIEFRPELWPRPDWWPKQCPIIVNILYIYIYLSYLVLYLPIYVYIYLACLSLVSDICQLPVYSNIHI